MPTAVAACTPTANSEPMIIAARPAWRAGLAWLLRHLPAIRPPPCLMGEQCLGSGDTSMWPNPTLTSAISSGSRAAGGRRRRGVVVAAGAGVEEPGVARAAVVVVSGGGGSGLPLTSGGGLIGEVRLEPTMFTSICWAADWSTVSTSPRLPKALEETVRSVCVCRLFGRSRAVRCGAVRCGAVRCGAVRCGAVRCGAVRCGAARLAGVHIWQITDDLAGRRRPFFCRCPTLSWTTKHLWVPH